MKYETGDCIYYIDSNNKVVFAEIYRVYESCDSYCTLDLSQFRYVTVHKDNCFEEEKHAKVVLKERKKVNQK